MEKLEPSTAAQRSQPDETYAWAEARSAYQWQPGVVESNMRVVHNQTSSQRVQPALTEVAERPSASTNAIESACRTTNNVG